VVVIRLASLDHDDERDALRRAARTGQWFLGANPRTETVPHIHRRLAEREARLLGVHNADGELAGLAGSVRGSGPAQATVDVVALAGGAPAPMVRALVDFLWHFERVESFLKAVEHDDAREQAFRSCGFTDVGVLREQYFAAGRYHDQTLLHMTYTERARSR
jgi:hypothetical protein